MLGYFVNMRAEQQAQEQIAKADELYNAGNRAEAVAIYKETFPHAQRGSRGRMVARIIGCALESGDKAEADQWVRRAVDDNLPIAEYDQAAGQAVADAKQAIEVERERKRQEAEEHDRLETERRQREAEERKRQAELNPKKTPPSATPTKSPIVSEDRPDKTPAKSKYIPGLQPVDVYLNFTNKGFTLTKDLGGRDELSGGVVNFWYCEETTSQSQSRVTVMGPSATQVESVHAMFTYSGSSASDTDKHARDFLAYVATLPYDNARPADAKVWVQSNIGKNAKTTIGGVSFELFANAPRARILLLQVASEVLGKPAFDVPSLIGKSIDEVRGVLGKPDDREPEPTKLQLQIGVDEWFNSYEKDGQELMVTFNPRNRVVIDFFLTGDSKAVLMQIANLREGDSAYRVEVIQAINAPGQITGIKVVPIRQSSTMRIEMQIEQKGVPAPPTTENKSVAKPMRTWTDTSGQFSVTASFAGYAFGKVKLRKEDGSVIEVEFAKLSLADQDYVERFR